VNKLLSMAKLTEKVGTGHLHRRCPTQRHELVLQKSLQCFLKSTYVELAMC
jgi:hypothetical protein